MRLFSTDNSCSYFIFNKITDDRPFTEQPFEQRTQTLDICQGFNIKLGTVCQSGFMNSLGTIHKDIEVFCINKHKSSSVRKEIRTAGRELFICINKVIDLSF